ncbi:chloride channel protein [Pseudonocardia sp. N23]|uniref:chloride channel protein n=1 Tax=Pseudonocardia sp. N23 TaxID=1987376 RepID=UPI000C034A7F|nr:chloride channel protein [Pseudonocardia sp. N23]GAY12729.1 chloride channel protein [Pseudonocardia sp. N23]
MTGSRPGLVGLALIIGVGAGLGAVAFRFLILGITELVTGRQDFSDAGRAPSLHLPALGPWFLLITPIVGGALYGPLMYRFAPEARGHGVPEVMLAVARNGGRIPVRVAVVKSLASALCIGTGGSVGREGPIVQIGSALGSSIGQWLRVPDHRLRLMVACGAAGGISATFNAPIAGVFFALEIILRRFTAESFGIVVISSVTADAVAHVVVGDDHILRLPAYALGSAAEFPLYAVLGLAAGVTVLRRGIDIDADGRGDDSGLLRRLTVADAMRPAPDPVLADSGLAELAVRLGSGRYGAVPVVDADGARVGAAVAEDLVDDVGERRDEPRAGDMARRLPELDPGTSLHDALQLLADHDVTGLPVVSSPGGAPVGWIDHRDVLTTYRLAPPAGEPPPRADDLLTMSPQGPGWCCPGGAGRLRSWHGPRGPRRDRAGATHRRRGPDERAARR